jgi:hypothetical protein
MADQREWKNESLRKIMIKLAAEKDITSKEILQSTADWILLLKQTQVYKTINLRGGPLC